MIWIYSTGMYRCLLQRFWGFYVPVETQIDHLKEQITLPLDFSRREKTCLLASDLQATGILETDLPALPLCTYLPELESVSQVLGCLYVFEGATLGGQMIARHIKQHLHLTEGYGYTFFNSYGRDVGTMWRSFRDIFVTYTLVADAEDAIISSACETFLQFNRWLLEGART